MANAGLDHDATLQWQVDVSLLGQPTMVTNFIKVIAIAAAVCTVTTVLAALTSL